MSYDVYVRSYELPDSSHFPPDLTKLGPRTIKLRDAFTDWFVKYAMKQTFDEFE